MESIHLKDVLYDKGMGRFLGNGMLHLWTIYGLN